MINVTVKGDYESYHDILCEDTRRKYGFAYNRREVVKSFLKEGKKWEAFFAEAVKNTFNQDVHDAGKQNDMFKHVDLIVDGKNESILVDVKGPKKNRRMDKKYDDSIVWIEAVNGDGYRGWIYGESDYIAFISRDRIMMVDRRKLVDVYENKVKGKKILPVVPDSTLVPYQRTGRKDIIFKMSKDEIDGMCDIRIDISPIRLPEYLMFK